MFVCCSYRGIRSVDRIVDLCERDLAFIWLTRGQKPKRDVFYDFKNRKLTSDVLDDLNYQLMRRLQKEGLVTLKELFIDGTKIEANANRYTFVWRGSINYHLTGLLDSIDQLFEKYNFFLQENDYGTKYELGNAQMFVIEGMDKVREVIEKNRKRKLVKHNLCPRPELLFLPGCSGRLSYRLYSGSSRKLEFQNGILCDRIPYFHRCPAWPTGLRFLMPFRSDPGSAE